VGIHSANAIAATSRIKEGSHGTDKYGEIGPRMTI
jgi:hypothetical protein